MGTSPPELFLAHLARLAGGVEPVFFQIEATAGLAAVVAVAYRGYPSRGQMTAFTYGLSLAEHVEWTAGKPELCICVRSMDERWAQAVAYTVDQMRVMSPFSRGTAINFGARISKESKMDGFLVSESRVLTRYDLTVDVGADRPITIAGIYPTYQSERDYVAVHGLDALWQRVPDPTDVKRPPAA
ncbi:MAG: suppressor of fused domain protein [Candidatus Dormibacteria bacterium]